LFSHGGAQAPPATLTSSHWFFSVVQRHRLAVERGGGDRRHGRCGSTSSPKLRRPSGRTT
jgi:hypothetical protein